jgi:cytochrome c556
MQKLMMVVCALLGMAICASAAISAEDLAAAVKERRDLMKKTVAPAAKLGGQMVKGVVPFDGAKAAKAMNDISGVPDKYVTLVPKGTEQKDASAKAAGAAEQGKGTFTAAFRRTSLSGVSVRLLPAHDL